MQVLLYNAVVLIFLCIDVVEVHKAFQLRAVNINLLDQWLMDNIAFKRIAYLMNIIIFAGSKGQGIAA